jgi:hypothetical protein
MCLLSGSNSLAQRRGLHGQIASRILFLRQRRLDAVEQGEGFGIAMHAMQHFGIGEALDGMSMRLRTRRAIVGREQALGSVETTLADADGCDFPAQYLRIAVVDAVDGLRRLRGFAIRGRKLMAFAFSPDRPAAA